MIKLLIMLLVLSFCLNVSAENLLQTMKRLPDTGQQKSYTNTFGEDSDFNINPQSFVKVNNFITIDTVTGLMWQRIDGGEMTYENAKIYCDTLTLGGFSDWRLPEVGEAFSILNFDKNNPPLDTNYFAKTAAEYWWAMQKQANDSTRIWETNAGGGTGSHPKNETISAGGTKKFHVRAVRDMTPPPIIVNQYQKNDDGTITDLISNLTWIATPLQDTLTWEDALIQAKNLFYAGYSDWRLPNIKELQTLTDESIYNPSINKEFFSLLGNYNFWSSTSLPNQPLRAWYLDTRVGITTYFDKTRRLKVVFVRSANVNTSVADESVDLQNYGLEIKNGILYISSNSKFIKTQLFNMLGEEMLLNQVGFNQYDLSDYPKGIYMLIIESDNNSEYRKIIIS